MKKFYAFALMAMAAATAFAQNGAPLYATGEEPAFDPKWSPAEPVEFVYADGVYTADLKGLASFTISTVKGEGEQPWDTFNTGRLYCNYGDVPGEAKPLSNERGEAPNQLPENILTPWPGDYHVVVSGDLKTITLTTNTPEPAKQIYLRGDMNGWGTGDEWLLKQDGTTTVYYLNLTTPIAAGDGFKIADANWGKDNYGVNSETDPDPLMLDVPYTLVYNGGNIILSEECAGSVVFDLSSGDVTFSNDKYTAGVHGVMVDDNAPVKYFNLQGVSIDEPAHGLYIVVKGGKAVKVVK